MSSTFEEDERGFVWEWTHVVHTSTTTPTLHTPSQSYVTEHRIVRECVKWVGVVIEFLKLEQIGVSCVFTKVAYKSYFSLLQVW